MYPPLLASVHDIRYGAAQDSRLNKAQKNSAVSSGQEHPQTAQAARFFGPGIKEQRAKHNDDGQRMHSALQTGFRCLPCRSPKADKISKDSQHQAHTCCPQYRLPQQQKQDEQGCDGQEAKRKFSAVTMKLPSDVL